MRTVAANVYDLISLNRLMAVALNRAEKGSPDEDSYFIEKLCKSAKALGFVLDTAPVEERAETKAQDDDDLEDLARPETFCRGCGEVKIVGMLVCWNCFKYRTDITPLKHYKGTFAGWLETVKEAGNA